MSYSYKYNNLPPLEDEIIGKVIESEKEYDWIKVMFDSKRDRDRTEYRLRNAVKGLIRDKLLIDRDVTFINKEDQVLWIEIRNIVGVGKVE